MKNNVLGLVFLTVAVWTVSGSAATMPLEWNPTYDVSVPYEVEIQRAKLTAAGIDAGRFVVKADGAALPTAMVEGKAVGSVRLRFTVPAGTKKLECETSAGEMRAVPGDAVDNLFAGALNPAKVASWRCKDGKVEARENGILITAKTRAEATYEVEVPAGLAGKAAQFEIELKNEGELAWPNNVRVEQVDAAGKTLMEPLSDPRWASHIRPVGKVTLIKEAGVIHPRAKKLRACLKLNAAVAQFDFYGYPVKSAEMKHAKLLVSRLTVRPGELLPFPKYDDCFFGEGVSGEAGDAAVRLGGEHQASIWYQTRAWGAWSNPHNDRAAQYRDESDIFFPAGAGTAEAWFKPEWQGTEVTARYLFEGSQHMTTQYRRANGKYGYEKTRGIVFAITYVPAKKELAFLKVDVNGKKFAATAKAEIPGGRWTHVAATWNPGGEGAVWIDGAKVLTVDMKDFRALDLANDYRPNDHDVIEAYLGGNYRISRDRDKPLEAAEAKRLLFQGLADNWRVSSGVRYTAAFTPAKRFAVDADTRSLFTFDRTWRGVSGGGVGSIPLTLYALTDRVEHTLEVDGRKVQYYPEAVTPVADPHVQLNALNYPVLPTTEDFLAGRRVEARTFKVKAGETMRLEAPEGVFTDFVEIANDGDGVLEHPIVLNRGDVDPRSYGDIRDTLCADSSLTDRERANRIFQYVLGASDYFMNHSAYFPLNGGDKCGDVEYLALNMLNGYCGFECGPLNSMTKNLYVCSGGLPASQTGGYGHSFQQVFFDGKNHVYDLSAQMFFPAWDNESAAYLEEMEDQPGLKRRAYGNPDHFIRNGTRVVGAGQSTYECKVAQSLRGGERFRVWFVNNGEVNELQCSHQTNGERLLQFFPDYGEKTHANQGEKGWRVLRISRFFPHYGNGFVEFDAKPADHPGTFKDEGASFVYHVHTVHPIVAADYSATRADGSAVELEFSTDCGKTYRPFAEPGHKRYDVRARYDYYVRVKAPLAEVAHFAASTEVQVNARIFPGRLRPGANELRLKATSGGAAVVTMGWRSNAKPLEIVGGVYSGTIPGAETQLAAVDPSQGAAEFAVKGTSARAQVITHGPVTAALAADKLTLTGRPGAKGFAYVTIKDGDVEKTLTVLVGEGVRLVKGADFTTAGNARKMAAGQEPHDYVLLEGAGAVAKAAFAPIPKGKYAILFLDRFAAHDPDSRLKPRLELSIAQVKGKKCARAVNASCQFYKAMYGRKGGRANWKWDYPLRPELSYYLEQMQVFELDGADSIEFKHVADDKLKGGVELAGALIVPSPDLDLYGDLIKVLCGLNCQPARISSK